MDFEIWQINKIRTALHNFKKAYKKNGKKCADVDISNALRTNDKVLEKYRLRKDKEETRPIDKEAIRRFLAEISTPHHSNLQDIIVLLIDMGALREDEIEGRPDELKEILTVTGYLGDRTEQALGFLDALPEKWRIDHKSDEETSVLTLTTARNEGTHFFYVEESLSIQRGKSSAVVSRARGYGFLLSNSNAIHMLLKDSAGSPVIYTEIGAGMHGDTVLAVRNQPIFRSDPSSVRPFEYCTFWLERSASKTSEEGLQRMKAATESERNIWGGSWGYHIFVSAANDDADALESLLNNKNIVIEKIDINYADQSQMTPLLYAAWNGSDKCADLLINSSQCDYLARDSFGNYASDLAFSPGNNFDLSERLFALELKQAQEQGINLDFNKNIRLVDFS